jgi:membrane dipeptidase
VIYVNPSGSPFAPESISYRTPKEAYHLAMHQMDYYHRLNDESDKIVLIREKRDLDEVLATWGPDKHLTDRKQGMMVLMEGADPILEPPQLEEWYERGLRIVGLAWDTTQYSGSCYHPGPLTKLGRELLEVMARFRMILDLSHMAEMASLEALDVYEGPIIASHSNPRHFIDRERMISDVQIDRLAERDGVVGIVPYNIFIKKGWTVSDPPDSVRLADVVGMIDYVCQRTGSARHVGIGSDIEGSFGAEAMPAELDTIADFWRIRYALADYGYCEEDIHNILCGNFLRQVHRCLG